MPQQFPARLHILLAQDAEIGKVLRRGPSKQVCSIFWDRQNDEFHLGQWLKGRVYERRSDLSPDGKHLIYFAMNGKWQSKTGGAWTAISQAPYLKPIVLLAKGDCWHGGGLFTDATTYWLNDGYGHTVLADSPGLHRATNYMPTGGYGNECLSVYFPRLQRDGWGFIEAMEKPEGETIHIFEKALPNDWFLRKVAHAGLAHLPGKGPYWDEHFLYHEHFDSIIACPDWEWADLDRTRLVWAAKGQLCTGYLDDQGIRDRNVLHDFNAMQFEETRAPY